MQHSVRSGVEVVFKMPGVAAAFPRRPPCPQHRTPEGAPRGDVRARASPGSFEMGRERPGPRIQATVFGAEQSPVFLLVTASPTRKDVHGLHQKVHFLIQQKPISNVFIYHSLSCRIFLSA